MKQFGGWRKDWQWAVKVSRLKRRDGERARAVAGRGVDDWAESID